MVTEMERACMRPCASQHVERRRPAAGLVQKMWSRGENTQVTIHTLLAGVTNSYRAVWDYDMTELRMDGNKHNHTLSVSSVIEWRYKYMNQTASTT